MRETHTGNADVTQHPVELGVDISDHIRAKPKEYAVQGLISDYPVSSQPTNVSRAREGFLALERMKDTGQLVSVQASLKGYDNMAITSLVATKDPKTGDVLDVTMTLRQVRAVTSQTITLPQPKKNNAIVQPKKDAALQDGDGKGLKSIAKEFLVPAASKLFSGFFGGTP